MLSMQQYYFVNLERGRGKVSREVNMTVGDRLIIIGEIALITLIIITSNNNAGRSESD